MLKNDLHQVYVYGITAAAIIQYEKLNNSFILQVHFDKQPKNCGKSKRLN